MAAAVNITYLPEAHRRIIYLVQQVAGDKAREGDEAARDKAIAEAALIACEAAQRLLGLIPSLDDGGLWGELERRPRRQRHAPQVSESRDSPQGLQFPAIAELLVRIGFDRQRAEAMLAEANQALSEVTQPTGKRPDLVRIREKVRSLQEETCRRAWELQDLVVAAADASRSEEERALARRRVRSILAWWRDFFVAVTISAIFTLRPVQVTVAQVAEDIASIVEDIPDVIRFAAELSSFSVLEQVTDGALGAATAPAERLISSPDEVEPVWGPVGPPDQPTRPDEPTQPPAAPSPDEPIQPTVLADVQRAALDDIAELEIIDAVSPDSTQTPERSLKEILDPLDLEQWVLLVEEEDVPAPDEHERPPDLDPGSRQDEGPPDPGGGDVGGDPARPF